MTPGGPLHTFVCMLRLAGFDVILSEDQTSILGPNGCIAEQPGPLLLVRCVTGGRFSPFNPAGRDQEETQEFDPLDLPAGVAAVINIGLADPPKVPVGLQTGKDYVRYSLLNELSGKVLTKPHPFLTTLLP